MFRRNKEPVLHTSLAVKFREYLSLDAEAEALRQKLRAIEGQQGDIAESIMPVGEHERDVAIVVDLGNTEWCLSWDSFRRLQVRQIRRIP